MPVSSQLRGDAERKFSRARDTIRLDFIRIAPAAYFFRLAYDDESGMVRVVLQHLVFRNNEPAVDVAVN